MRFGSAGSLPVPLPVVLEEESIRLRGASNPALPKKWEVKPEDVTNVRAVIERIEAAFVPPLFEPPQEGADPRTALADALNNLLEELWKRKLWFSSASAFALELPQYTKLAPPDSFPEDEVFNLNRQMLDVVCRGDLKSAVDVQLSAVIKKIHEAPPRAALCISGGGIRSATFALGVLQGLAKCRLLDKFDFLSTVSGGGYVGSWLSSWIRRNDYGVRGVSEELHASTDSKTNPQSAPVEHLREYSNYLTPKLGGLSADTWTLIGIYLRNLLLNWLVIIPLLIGVLTVPRLMTAAVLSSAPDAWGVDTGDWWSKAASTIRSVAGRAHIAGVEPGSFELNAKIWIAFLVGGFALLLAFGYLARARPVSEREEQNPRRTNGDFILKCVAPIFVAAICFNLAWAWYQTPAILKGHRRDVPPLIVFLALGASIALASWSVYNNRSKRVIHTRRLRDEKDTDRRMEAEMGAAAISSGVAGILFWAAAKIFPDPVSPLATLTITHWPLERHIGLNAVTEWYVCFGVPLVFLILFLQCALFVGFSSRRNEDYDREWWARAASWVLIGGVVWIVLSLVTIFGPVALYLLPKTLAALGGAAGLFSLVAGSSDKTTAKGQGQRSIKDKALDAALGLAIPLFLLLILAAISLGTTTIIAHAKGTPAIAGGSIDNAITRASLTERRQQRIDPKTQSTTRLTEKPFVDNWEIRSLEHLNIVHRTDLLEAMVVIIACIGGALLISLFIGVNAFSMHSMYRNRLIRAYLGASRGHRKPNLFTGFDPQDNLAMHMLRPEMLWAYSFVEFDNFAKTLVPPAIGPLQPSAYAFLWRLLDSNDSQPVLRQFVDDKKERHKAMEVLFENINAILDRYDLPAAWTAFTTSPADELLPAESHDRLRSLKNRQFLDEHFGDDIYPHPMPLLCSNDVLDRHGLLERIRTHPNSDLAANAVWEKLSEPEQMSVNRNLPDELDAALSGFNRVIRGSDLATTLPFSRNVLGADDRAPYTFDKNRKIHKFLENRLLIDKQFPELAPLRPSCPMHVVNVALNLVSGEKLAWQERKAESFTFTSAHSGSLQVGYRDTTKYGQISLGTAVTISGAAASPNMGYHSSPALALVMTLFNVRLGWWLGNPGVAGNTTYEKKNPSSSIGPLINEALGNTNDRYPYVYLSDGGHFDNLGLYEMVLRRCRYIVVSDAGSDSDFKLEDLGNAIRKIRIDLGINIKIDEFQLIARNKNESAKYCAVGNIQYSDVDGPDTKPGTLVYLKPVFYEKGEGVPKDIFNYAQQNPEFPHESTADQFFSESQFESYRALGEYAVSEICQNLPRKADFEDFLKAAKLHSAPENKVVPKKKGAEGRRAAQGPTAP